MIKDIKSLLINLSPLAAIILGKGIGGVMNGQLIWGSLEVVGSIIILASMFYLIFKTNKK